MATIYTYSEARQKFSSVLEQVVREGEVRVKQKDGQEFVIQVAPQTPSPLDVEGIDLGLSSDEILQFIQEGRKYE